jgi:hypothetical protein
VLAVEVFLGGDSGSLRITTSLVTTINDQLLNLSNMFVAALRSIIDLRRMLA